MKANKISTERFKTSLKSRSLTMLCKGFICERSNNLADKLKMFTRQGTHSLALYVF